jgi:uncharacterized protein YggU (UPF0235/DUF167 family)
VPRRPLRQAATLPVRLTPGAAIDRVDGPVDGVLRVRVAARPTGGAANEALLRLLAGDLGLARSRVTLRRGAASRLKLVAIDGLESEALRSRWPGLDV